MVLRSVALSSFLLVGLLVGGGSAAAHEFHSESAPALLQGVSTLPGFFENPVSEQDVECQKEKSSLQGTVSKTATSSVTLHPIYQNCIAKGTEIKVEIITLGCDYIVQGTTGAKGHLQFSIQCEAGKSLELKVGSYCTAKIGSQTPGGGLVYENQGSGASRDIKLVFTPSEIVYTTIDHLGGAGCPIFFGNGKDLTLTGTFTLKGMQDPGASQVGIWVE